MSETKYTTFHANPFTDDERAEIAGRYRGRVLPNGMVRDFCLGCGLPTEFPPGEKLGEWHCGDCEEEAKSFVPSHRHST